LGPDGKEIDWIAGYTPPPEKFQAQILCIIQGIDTLPSLEIAQIQDPKNPEPLIKLGLKYQKRHHREKALECFKEAALLDPEGKKTMRRDTGEIVSCKEMADFQYAKTHVVTFGLIDIDKVKAYIKNYSSGQLLKEAYLEISRFQSLDQEEGQDFFNEFISKFPDDPDVLNAYIEEVHQIRQSLEDNPAYDKGVEFAERIIEVYPELTRFQATNSYAQFLIDNDDTEAAETVFGEDFLASQVQSWAENLLTYAEFWLNKKQNKEEAEKAITRVLSLAPDNPEVLRRAANAYHNQLGSPDKALHVFGPSIIPKISANPRALYDYFKFWITLKTNEVSAENALEMLWTLKPETVYFRIGAASVFRSAGKMARALAVFGPDFAAEHHDDMSALYYYGIYWVRLNLNLESAVPALVKALSLSPSTWINQRGAAQALAKINKPEEALQVFGPEYLPYIKNDAGALSRYADYWIKENKNKESTIEALEMAIRIEELIPFDRHSLAFTCVRAGLLERVEEFYGPEYLSEIYNDPQALNYYASFWGYQEKNMSSALEAAELACKLDKDNPRIWTTRARILMTLGRNEHALMALDKAISLEKYKEDKERHEPMRKQILEALKKK
jgi:tetratricopeptide (TPR) repeat protein